MSYIIHEMDQRGYEWNAIRKGKFTASVASKLITPTGKLSIQWKSEIDRMIAEAKGWQEEDPGYKSYWMERGVNLEPEARGWFQVLTGKTVRQVGFIEAESGIVGFSPDGIIEEDGLIIPVEMKVPKPSTHIGWLRGGEPPKDHLPQVHFAMAICHAPYAYFFSYLPEADCVEHIVERGPFTEVMEQSIIDLEAEFRSAWKGLFGEEYRAKGDSE